MPCGEKSCGPGGVEVDPAFIDRALEQNDYDPENLIMILQDITAEYNYVPPEALDYVARNLGVPLSLIYTAATFYKAFSLTPRGKFIINVCVGTACHVRGSEAVVDVIAGELGIHTGETTGDLKFTLDTVRCLGCCALGPVLTVNDKSHGGLDRGKTLKVLKGYEKTQ